MNKYIVENTALSLYELKLSREEIEDIPAIISEMERFLNRHENKTDKELADIFTDDFTSSYELEEIKGNISSVQNVTFTVLYKGITIQATVMNNELRDTICINNKKEERRIDIESLRLVSKILYILFDRNI